MGTITVRSLYEEPASGPIYAFDIDEETGSILDSYLIPLEDFQPLNPVPADYVLYCPPAIERLAESAARSLAVAKDRHRVVFDLVTQGEALAAGVRPWTISKILQPMVEIVQKAFNLQEAQFNKLATLPRLQVGSFEATIELDYGPDLFAGAVDFPKFNAVIDLINARSPDEFHALVGRFPSEAFIKDYLTVVNAVRKYNLTIEASLANPVSEQVLEAQLDKQNADSVRDVINTVFDEIVDIEEIKGVFLELDFSIRNPSFVVMPLEENTPLRGRIANTLSTRLGADDINLTKKTYTFAIKTVYQPPSSLRPEKTQKWLIDYTPVVVSETPGTE